MRVLLVWASAAWSVRDVTTGYRRALIRAGHVVRDYRLDQRLLFIQKATPPEQQRNLYGISKMASESVLAEAIYHNADLVLVISGLLFHEIGLWLLTQYGVRTAVILTESPYQDVEQAEWLAKYPTIAVFTHEAASAAKFGWTFLPHAYDPEIHRPVPPDPDEVCDVLFVGSGFPERQTLFEAIPWDGIRLRLRGHWPGINGASVLSPYVIHGAIENADLPPAYTAARINLNPHRATHGEAAVSLNPRAYELAACGAFQISDGRAEGRRLFGVSVPTAQTPDEWAEAIRYFLAHDTERRACAEDARSRVQGETFDARLATLLTTLAHQAAPAAG